MQSNQLTLNPFLLFIFLFSLLLALFTFSPSSLITTTTTTAATPTCNLFKGKWVPQPESTTSSSTLYSNKSCGTLPSSKNCLLHGRPDTGFLRWRWVPNGCELPGFDPLEFLKMVAGKTAAFVGDSVARNHVESLLCMLATEEKPLDVYKDAKDRSRTWHFPRHNFTLMVLWTRFLVKHKERGINGLPTGIYDLHLDELDETWATHFRSHQPPIDYVILSDSQWFFRKNFLYEKGQLLGCTYCNDTTTIDLGPTFAIRMALRSSLRHILGSYINGSSSNGMIVLVRTVSPSHFENGTWKTGGRCERRRPVEELMEEGNGGLELEVRKAQVEEVERVKKEGKRLGLGLGFEALDITWAMLMRPDGHPGQYWRHKKKGYNDCVHWCLPGPIDLWNDLLLALLKKLGG